jgi:hypothetical protein
MARKLLVVGLILSALVLMAVVISAPIQAQAQSGTEPPPDSQSIQAPDALPVFAANLTGAEVVPSVSTTARGRAVLVLNDDLTTLLYHVSVTNIGGISGAHLRVGEAGENGAEVFNLYNGSGVFDPDHPISGTLTLTPAQVTELIIGNYYIDIDTGVHPSGELRGQIQLHSPSNRFNALMTGIQETPPVTTPATGVGTFTLNSSLDQLSYHIAVSDIMSITLAHLHKGAPGVAGPPVVTIYTGTVPFDPSNPISGTVAINAQNLLDLLTGQLYANIHTTAHPAGEIRGQVLSGYTTFEAELSGAQETPPVTTTATGRAVMVLDSDLQTLHYRLMVTDLISITAAHIHLGAPGVSGGIVFPLYTGGGPFDEDNPVSGTVVLTETEQLNTLLAGNYYVNIHTSTYPAGEIRGQLLQFTPGSRYSARLSGAEEVPPVTTNATGMAEFLLNTSLDSLQYDIRVQNIEDITLAHLHRGARGQAGPPVIPLYTGGGEFDPDHPLRGTAGLTAQDLLDLLTGYLYANVHTQSFPNGEIRGQVEAVTGYTLYLPILFKP